jgi:hypothetical protein
MLAVDLKQEDYSGVADWIEAQILIREGWSASVIHVENLMLEVGLTDYEDYIAGALNILRQRAKQLGDYYPIEMKGQHFIKSRSGREPNDLYKALLILSLIDSSKNDQNNSEFGELFEIICEPLLRNLGGAGGNSLHFGWPTRSGRPQKFPHAIQWLAKKLSLDVGKGHIPKQRKDGGVDLVVWRTQPNGESMNLNLVQCTLQNDVSKKAKDIDTRLWETWISFPQTPGIILAVPFTVPDRDMELKSLKLQGYVVLTRLDLVKLGKNLTNEQIIKHKFKEIFKLADEV